LRRILGLLLFSSVLFLNLSLAHAVYQPDGNAIIALGMNSDASSHATGHFDRTIRIWDTATGDVLHIISDDLDLSMLSENVYTIQDMEFNTDDSQLAVTFGGGLDEPGRIRVYNTSNGEMLSDFIGGAFVSDVSWKPNGTLLAVETTEGSLSVIHGYIDIWDVEMGELVYRIDKGLDASSVGVAWSPDGQWIASADQRVVRLWSASNYMLSSIVLRSNETIMDIVWTVDSERLMGVDVFRNVY
jgi:WD40 repeat protein